MQAQAATQGANAPLPPIPKMDQAPRAASDARQAAQDARAAVQEIRQAVKAELATQNAPKVVGGNTQGPAGTTSSTAPPAAFPEAKSDIPPEVVPMLGIIFGSLTVMLLGFPIVRVLTRRFDRGTEHLQTKASDVTPQLRQLQDSIDAMAIEIERISEAQRFTARLLSERAPEKAALEAPKQG